MAGPPSQAYGQLTLLFSGSEVPLGAACTIGHLFPSDTGFYEGLASELTDLHEAIASFDCVLDSVTCKIGPQATGPSFSLAVGAEGQQSAGNEAPAQALLVTKLVANVSGRLQGRFFYPGVPRGSLEAGGRFSSAALAQYNTALAAFYTYMTSFDADPQVFSSSSSDPRTVTGFRAEQVAATQRRRQRR